MTDQAFLNYAKIIEEDRLPDDLIRAKIRHGFAGLLVRGLRTAASSQFTRAARSKGWRIIATDNEIKVFRGKQPPILKLGPGGDYVRYWP